ncbi:hypothetical protein Ga0466249_005222 [Sporomusaceae bacterium BoRhaA]|uniref:hypothetical protein n=1 Tax=Pelorhabdus rhamnosifermentans TaxID=2772457 RepID=UPI001C05F816|nr:hypothetical protein [Pelorhabdus rhamnosifermentans]MBU2704070.1 hypothetical protein [Pelorhabdus rhamnosifermentans]
MMKKVVSGVAALLMLSSVGFASPLNDFSQGKVAVDVSVRPSSDVKASDLGTADVKSYMDYGLTVGLGNDLAFQYKGANPESETVSGFSGKLTTQEFNLLYKTSDNFTVFTGINQAKAKWNDNGFSAEGDTKSNWQLGVTGQTPLGENLTGYATVAAGQDTSTWKIGLGYAISKNLDLDVFYGENKYNKVKNPWNSNNTSDYTIKGMGYGLTYKF